MLLFAAFSYVNTTGTRLNRAAAGDAPAFHGGAIHTENSATLTVINSTISGNKAQGGSSDAGGINVDGGTATIANSTISGDTTGNITGQDPNLGPLRDNGGPTQTRVPLAGSPAIDAANPTTFPATDQRGLARPVDGNGDATARADIGAVERQPADPNAAPDTSFEGYDFWLGKLNEFGGDYIRAEMVRAFIESGEYRKRFGQ